jgi:hypothetical protein
MKYRKYLNWVIITIKGIPFPYTSSLKKKVGTLSNPSPSLSEG